MAEIFRLFFSLRESVSL